MPQHHVDIQQLNSPLPGKSYLNVVDNVRGEIKIWASRWQPNTYLFFYENTWEIVVFDNNEFAQEYIEKKHPDSFQLLSENIA